MNEATFDHVHSSSESATTSIANGIQRIVMLCTTLGLLLACAAFAAYDLFTFRISLVTNASMLAEVTANNSVGALAFGDDQAAMDALEALAASPSMRFAAILDSGGSIFVEHSRDDSIASPAAQDLFFDGSRFLDGELFVGQPIYLGGEVIGMVSLVMGLEEQAQRLWRFAVIGLLIMFLSFATAVWLSRRLRGAIVSPISALTSLAETVSNEEDYSLRAESSDITEIAVLANGVNKMMGAIEARDGQLQRGRERLELALTASGQGMWDYDLETEEIFLDERVARLLGAGGAATRRDLEARLREVHEDDMLRISAAIEAHFAQEAENIEVDHRIRIADEWRWMRLHGKLVEVSEDGAPARLVGTYADIDERKRQDDERKRLEADLHRAQKLESIGQLAAGIAHEINTPIQFVGDNTRFLNDVFGDVRALIEDLAELCEKNSAIPVDAVRHALESLDIEYIKEEVPGAISQTLEGIERVRRIVKAMKDFSHPSENVSQADLNHAIESTVAVASSEWKYVADIVLDLDETLPLVSCVLGEINQVILNIIVNAAHAISGVVDAESGEKGRITVTSRTDGQWAEIRIADTGGGIPDEILPKIFDPFFTTKDVGKGTGQGLNMAHSIIAKKHGGTLSVETEAGSGSCFVIRLPLAGVTTRFDAVARA